MNQKVKTLSRVGMTSILAGSLVFGSLFIDSPIKQSVGLANDNKIQKLQQDINNLKKKEAKLKQHLADIDAQQRQLKNEQNSLEKDVLTLDIKISETELKISTSEAEVNETQALALEKAQDLKEAEERIKLKEELLKTRIRSTYELGGQVNYLEVLFGASSLGDLLNRVDFLSLIVEQDQKIIADFIQEKEDVEKKKVALEQLLVKLEGQLAELNQLKASIVQKQKEKRVRIAAIDVKQEELEEIADGESQAAIQLANEISKKFKEVHSLSFDGVFAWPVPDSHRITSKFGTRTHPITGKVRKHTGTDIGAPQGTTIVAAAEGIVVTAEYLRGYGNTVIIEHGDGVRTLYAHIKNGGIHVKVGQSVKKGAKIAGIGSTGNSTGPHLHFEVHKNGTQVDPMKYLQK